ncbi:MAG: hypothetical protein PHT58_04385 [Eubacteriales bacterium]|nr:hypothetical protein [Eubacteriales bacterium]
MARRRRRMFQPKFFLFLIATLLLIAGIVVMVIAISNKITSCENESSLAAPSTADPLATVNPLASPTENPIASTPPPLSSTSTYTVSGSNNGVSYEIRRNNESKELSSNPNSSSISFGSPDSYTNVKGLITFGSNNYRNSFAYGTVTVTMQELAQKWVKPVGGIDQTYGVNGQPLIVQWDDEVKKTLGISDLYKTMEGFTEVIYPCADGNIYFFELESGAATRNPINLGVSLLGTPTLDPNGYPILYVGQGVPVKNERGNYTAMVYAVDLIQNKSVHEFIGKDYFAYRDNWTAFSSSPLISDDTLILPGEAGVIYFIKLNTSFDATANTITINPGDRIKYRYTASGYSATDNVGSRWYGFQGSVSAFRNYLYIADNGGYLQCIDVNTLKLQFALDLGGDTDATVVIEEDGNDGTIYLYTVNQTTTKSGDIAFEGDTNSWGYSIVRKINGLTGSVVWVREQPCLVGVGDTSLKSGAKGTPHIGHGEIANLLICSFYRSGIPDYDDSGSLKGYSQGGTILALNCDTGEIVWRLDQRDSAGFAASPLVLYNSDGNAFMVACERTGQVKLFDISSSTCGVALGRTLDLGSGIESTPAAFNNFIVLGTTGRLADGSLGQANIFGIKLG